MVLWGVILVDVKNRTFNDMVGVFSTEDRAIKYAESKEAIKIKDEAPFVGSVYVRSSSSCCEVSYYHIFSFILNRPETLA